MQEYETLGFIHYHTCAGQGSAGWSCRSSPYLVLAAMLLINCLSTTGLLVNRGQTTFPLDIFNLLDICKKIWLKSGDHCLPLVSPPQ